MVHQHSSASSSTVQQLSRTVNLIYGKDSESEFINIMIDVAYGTINSEIAKKLGS